MRVLHNVTDTWARTTTVGLKALLMTSVAGVLLITLVPARGPISAGKIASQSAPALVSGNLPLTPFYALSRSGPPRRSILDHPSTLFTEGEPMASELIRRVLDQPVATAPRLRNGSLFTATEVQ